MKAWIEVNPQMFLPFPYAGMDFRGDPNMGLPLVMLGGQQVHFLCFLHLYEYVCAYVFC